MSAPAPSPLGAWWLAARPRTLSVSLVPVAVGTGVAQVEGGAVPVVACAAAVGALGLQLASNFVNDAADYERGADAADRVGPARAAQSGWISARALYGAALGVLVAVAAVGWFLVARGGWPIALGGVLAAIAAWAYTGGPVPLGYRGLGDLLVFVFFGLFAVVGTAWVQRLEGSTLAFAAALPIGALATAILAVNNLRDRDGDATVGKRTVAVRLSARAARIYTVACGVVAWPLLLGVAAAGAPTPAWALPLLSAPLGWRWARATWAAHGAALNAQLGGAARLQLVFGALLALGLGWPA